MVSYIKGPTTFREISPISLNYRGNWPEENMTYVMSPFTIVLWSYQLTEILFLSRFTKDFGRFGVVSGNNIIIQRDNGGNKFERRELYYEPTLSIQIYYIFNKGFLFGTDVLIMYTSLRSIKQKLSRRNN